MSSLGVIVRRFQDLEEQAETILQTRYKKSEADSAMLVTALIAKSMQEISNY
jgi:hypothetical protein